MHTCKESFFSPFHILSPFSLFYIQASRCSATAVLRFRVKDKDCCCCSTPLTDIKKPNKQKSNNPASILACSFYSHFSFRQEKTSQTNKQTKKSSRLASGLYSKDHLLPAFTGCKPPPNCIFYQRGCIALKKTLLFLHDACAGGITKQHLGKDH